MTYISLPASPINNPIRLLIEIGCSSLDVTARADADLDGTFEAVCNETGETLRINGWLMDDCERAEPIGTGE